jgi:gamma-glutamyltranspeptidase
MLQALSSLRGMATSPHHLASQAGLDVLRDGGTAVEAAVAVAATLAVVYPHMNSIGGDSFWLVREPNGALRGVNACGGAAGKADLALYAGLESAPWRGPLAANTVAGTISGWQALREGDSGVMPLERLLREAIFHAENGVVVTKGWAELALAKHEGLVGQFGYAAVFAPRGQPLAEGAVVRQPALAHTLRDLARDGLGTFYEGALAKKIIADLARAGSPVTLEDLHRHQATTPQPLSARISGARLYNAAPPTQGFASLAILALYDRLRQGADGSFDFVHGLVEATKRAFRLRDAHIGDPAYMDFDPQQWLDDQAALDALAARIDPACAWPWPQPPSGGDTVWFGVIDGRGQAVSAIQSTYFEFGSGLVLPETGIIWQNRGCSFRLAPEGWNALRPYRKPFHTLNPALAVFDDGRTLVYGAMGGEGQPQTQAAVFTRYRQGLDLQAAITAPRWLLGRTWGENSVTLKLEDRFDPALVAALRAAGHEVELLTAFTSTMGHAGAIVRHADGRLEGACDPRSDGGVAAW